MISRSLILLTIIQLMLGSVAYSIGPAMGGELTYKYVNDSTYRFYYKYYAACSGFPEANEVSMCYRNTSCGSIWYTERLTKMVSTPDGKPNGQVTDPGCAGQTNSCNDINSTNEMYREWWYTGVVTIKACSKWIFSVNIYERDRDFISNLQIQPPWDHNLYVEATIDNVAARRQSSPYFTVSAPVDACAGSPFRYNGGVVDPDGDSLVYKIIQPRSATADLFVVCAGYPPIDMPFSGAQYNLTNNPLETGNTFSLNPNTGDISFTPVGAQAPYIALLVEKYRNGVLIGTIMRDWRMQIKNCSTPPTYVNIDPSSLSGGTLTRDTIFACGNTELNFCFNAGSTAAGTLKVSDNSKMVLEGATVTYQNQGTSDIKGCVTWIPPAGDVGFRYFVVRVKDSVCGPNSAPVIQTYKIPVMVRAGTELLTKDTFVCAGTGVKLYASGGTRFNWSASPQSDFSCLQCDTTIVTPRADVTKYTVTSNLTNGCKSTDTFTLYIDRSSFIIASPDTVVLCDGGEYVMLDAEAGGAKPLKTIACGPYSPVSDKGLTNIQIAQTTNNSFSNNVHYTWAEYWGPFYQYYKTQKMQIIIRKDELKHEGMKPGTLQRLALNFANFKEGMPPINPTFENVKIAMRCTDKLEFVSPSHSEFEIGLTEVFTAPSVTLKPGWNEFEFTIPYDYDTTKNLIVQFCYSGVNPQYMGYYNNKDSMLPIYYITTPYRASLWAGQTSAGTACSANLGSVVADRRRPDIRFSYTELPETDFKYTWSPAKGMDNPGAASTGVFAEKTTWYTVSTVGRSGCTFKDSVLVYVAEKDFAIDPAESIVCDGEVVRITGTGGYTYTWFNDDYTRPEGFSCLVCDTPNIKAPLGENFYKVIVADFYGCSDTLDASIQVKPIPLTRILNNDTTIGYGQSVQLFVEGAAYYLWSPMESLNNPAIASPVATPDKSTLYIVSGFDPDGCVVKDSVWVRISGGEEVFIPTAFSPNGDGNNDVFKIENLKHQRILSFSIFNRWGKEVYKAGLGQNGWDGTFKGAPAPMDTYFYHIALALTDGSTKVYRGDVTLVR